MVNITSAHQCFNQGNIAQAEQMYRQILSENKNNVEALWGMGRVALTFNSYQRAYELFKRCISLNSTLKQPQYLLSMSEACLHLMRFEEAEQALLAANKVNGGSVATFTALAIFYCEMGDFIQAGTFIKNILKIVPANVQAFCLLVRCKKLTLANNSEREFVDDMFNKLTLSTSVLTKREKILLHFSFAELFHENNEFEKAFSHFTQANALQRSLINFSVVDMKDYFDSLLSSFTHSTFQQLEPELELAETQKQQLTPIFIVGQPRSGSTLLEQMLIGHSAINSGGELPFMAGDIAKGIYQLTGKHFPEGASLLDNKQCRILGEHYLKNLQTLAPSSKYIIDKMPANYQSIGLIKLILPQAKIIHIKRDPIDVSWSIFNNHFESLEPYFCSLIEIGQYHHLYQKIMDNWQAVLPNFVHHISYEQLVETPEVEITKVLAFCKLEFQSNCLSMAGSKRYIRTLSDIQLREGIQKNNEKKWLSYNKYLQPLFDALNVTS